LFRKQKALPLLPGRSNATPNKNRFGMSFEAPLGLSTSSHLYAIKVNIFSPFNAVWGQRNTYRFISGAPPLNVIEDLIPARQGKSFATSA